jgi:hypothetical protein
LVGFFMRFFLSLQAAAISDLARLHRTAPFQIYGALGRLEERCTICLDSKAVEAMM